MTAPRIARANRLRLFLGLGIFVLVMGFIAVFHSSQTELDEMKLHCAKQQDSLNSQLTVSLKQARLHHTQSQRLNNTIAETNGKFAALQQSYKLLKIQNEDLNESFEKKRDDLQQRIEKLEATKGDELQKLRNDNEKLRTTEEKMSVTIQKLENEVRASKASELLANNAVKRIKSDVERQLEAYKSHCSWRPTDPATYGPTGVRDSLQRATGPQKQFKTQVQSKDNLYTVEMSTISTSTATSYKAKKAALSGVILNSVENFQIIPKPVIINPPLASESIPKGSSSQLKINEQLIDQIKPDLLSSTTAAPTKLRSRQVPKGVVPMLPSLPDEQSGKDEQIAITASNANSENKNNRYAGILEDIGGIAGQVLGIRKDLDSNVEIANMAANFHQSDVDNGANEINDEFQLDHKDHLVDSDVKINGNNAAEEDTNNNNNLFDNKAGPVHSYNLAKPNLRNGDDMDGIGEAHLINGDAGQQLDSNKKLINEIDADQGKVAEYPDDVHLEEQVEEEDDDEYDNPAARKQEPAVRN